MSEIVPPVKALAYRIADYAETAHTYDQWSKREAMIEAVRIACEDARSETLAVLGPPAQSDSKPRETKDGERSTCANCGQPIRFRFPPSHVAGFWLHDGGVNREGRESFDSSCALRAVPADDSAAEP